MAIQIEDTILNASLRKKLCKKRDNYIQRLKAKQKKKGVPEHYVTANATNANYYVNDGIMIGVASVRRTLNGKISELVSEGVITKEVAQQLFKVTEMYSK